MNAYGNMKIQTPVLDKLAGESVLFENAHSQSNWTVASHASMFTGLSPMEHGVLQLDHVGVANEIEGAKLLIPQAEYDTAFASCHALLGPTSPCPAFGLGTTRDPLTMYQCDIHTVNANMAGACAISLPGGTIDDDGVTLPVGIQLQCRAFDEVTMFRIARQLQERAREFAPNDVG